MRKVELKLSLIHYFIAGVAPLFFLTVAIGILSGFYPQLPSQVIERELDTPLLASFFEAVFLIIIFIPFGWISSLLIKKRYRLHDKWKIFVLSATYLIATIFAMNQWANYLASTQLATWGFGTYQEFHIDFSVHGFTTSFILGALFAIVSGFLLREE